MYIFFDNIAVKRILILLFYLKEPRIRGFQYVKIVLMTS